MAVSLAQILLLINFEVKPKQIYLLYHWIPYNAACTSASLFIVEYVLYYRILFRIALLQEDYGFMWLGLPNDISV